ncbi:MAG: hypothetical protein M1839_000630 [Geoglossum umbratile]|nr:MAG: hypothetical protein M1839_000630 [Geoglossum umbratile]
MSNPKAAHKPLSDSPTPPSSSKKRKHVVNAEARAKIVGRKRAKKTAFLDDGDDLVADGLNHAFAKMDRLLLSDYVARQVRRFGEDLSSVEMGDKYIPENAFKDTSGWDKPRSLQNLPDCLEYFSTAKGQPGKLSSAPDMNGAPHTIVVTCAGIRAADITRALRKFQTQQSTVAKLFAKHIKLKDAIAFVTKTRMGIAIGTPTRLVDLLSDGALSLEKLQRLVVDCSHIDQKKRGILDIRELQVPLMELLNRRGLKERYAAPENGVDLLFY